jgi:hypothetical protein
MRTVTVGDPRELGLTEIGTVVSEVDRSLPPLTAPDKASISRSRANPLI